MKTMIALLLGLGFASNASATEVYIELVKKDTGAVEYSEYRTPTQKETDRIFRPIKDGHHGPNLQGTCGQLIASTIQKWQGKRFIGEKEFTSDLRLKVRIGDIVQELVASCTTDDNTSAIPDVNACDNFTPHLECESHGQSFASANCTWEDLAGNLDCVE